MGIDHSNPYIHSTTVLCDRAIFTIDCFYIYLVLNLMFECLVCSAVTNLTSSGELIKCVDWKGSKKVEFHIPRGVTLYNHQMYVWDSDNRRIQVFDLDLNFIRSIGLLGKGRGELDFPSDITFDSAGNMYIADRGNGRVQVLDSSGYFIQLFGQEGEGRLRGPSSILIADQYVYVSDMWQDCIVVYTSSGQFVTSFGVCGQKEGQLLRPSYVTSCTDGYIYICDHASINQPYAARV